MSDNYINIYNNLINLTRNKLLYRNLNSEENFSIRLTFFVDEEGSWSSSNPVNMLVAPIAKPRSGINLENGKKGMISSFERINDNSMPPRAKVGANYINSRYAYLEAQSLSFDLPIMLDRMGKVSESSGSCLMMYRNGILITPPYNASIVESITRNTLLELSKKLREANKDLRNKNLRLKKENNRLKDNIELSRNKLEILISKLEAL